MRRPIALFLLLALLLVPAAYAQEISAVSVPSEVKRGGELIVYVRFANTLNETVVLVKVRIELMNQNGDLVNSSETEFRLPVPPNATATVSGSMLVDVEPGDYKYNVLVYYEQGGETKSKSVVSDHELLVKAEPSPRVALALTIIIFGVTLGFLVRLGSRGIAR